MNSFQKVFSSNEQQLSYPESPDHIGKEENHKDNEQTFQKSKDLSDKEKPVWNVTAPCRRIRVVMEDHYPEKN